MNFLSITQKLNLDKKSNRKTGNFENMTGWADGACVGFIHINIDFIQFSKVTLWLKAVFKVKYFSDEIQALEMGKKCHLNILFLEDFKSKFQKCMVPRYFIYNTLHW